VRHPVLHPNRLALLGLNAVVFALARLFASASVLYDDVRMPDTDSWMP